MTTICEAIARTIAHEPPEHVYFPYRRRQSSDRRRPSTLDRYTDALQMLCARQGAAVVMADGYAEASARLGKATGSATIKISPSSERDFCAIAGGFGWKAITLRRGGEIADMWRAMPGTTVRCSSMRRSPAT
jgi:hypothetical protein